jgi:Double zinc ribbon
MRSFRSEISIIPKAAWAVALGLFPLLTILAVLLFRQAIRRLGIQEIAVIQLVFLLLFGIYILMVGYIYADAKRRGMRYVLWTWIAILALNSSGVIILLLYFALRDPMPSRCQSCGTPLRENMLFCPACGSANKDLCPACGKPVVPDWANCAHCGIELPHDMANMQRVK